MSLGFRGHVKNEMQVINIIVNRKLELKYYVLLMISICNNQLN